jgi:acyl carrier protein
MTRDDIRARLTEIFREVLDDDGIVLADETTAHDVEEWDSLAHVRLIIAIEAALNIRFTTQEINAPENVGQLIDLIAAKFAPA